MSKNKKVLTNKTHTAPKDWDVSTFFLKPSVLEFPRHCLNYGTLKILTKNETNQINIQDFLKGTKYETIKYLIDGNTF